MLLIKTVHPGKPFEVRDTDAEYETKGKSILKIVQPNTVRAEDMSGFGRNCCVCGSQGKGIVIDVIDAPTIRKRVREVTDLSENWTSLLNWSFTSFLSLSETDPLDILNRQFCWCISGINHNTFPLTTGCY